MNEAIQSTRGFNVIFIHSSLDDAGLTAYQFRILAHISRRAGDGMAWESNQQMANHCKMSEETVTLSLKELENRCILYRELRPGRTTLWRLRSPDYWNLNGRSKTGKAGRPKSMIESNPPGTNPPHPPGTNPPHPPGTNPPEGDTRRKSQKRKKESARPREALFWNQHCGSLPKVLCFPENRQKKLLKRRQDDFWAQNFESAVLKVTVSKFCLGESDRGWRASFDWLIERPDSLAKVMEGKYDNRQNGTNRSHSVDRNAGTANASRIGQYDGIGKI